MVILVVCASVALAVTRDLKTSQDYQSTLVLFAPMGFLLLLALITSLVRMPEVSTLREVLLVLAVFVAGVFFSKVAGLRFTLLGVLLGAVAVAALSWFLDVDDFSSMGNYFNSAIAKGGVSGNRAIEYASSLIGIAAGLSLLHTKRRSFFALTPPIAFLIITLVFSGSLTALIGLTGTIFAACLLLLRGTRFARVAGFLALGASIASSILLLLLVTLREQALVIVSVFDSPRDLEARLVSWESMLKAFDPVGAFFGYGATFWLEGSAVGELANQPLKALNYGPFDISHSIYLDALAAFGIVGVILIGALIWCVLRKADGERKAAHQWTESAAPWIFAAAIGITGVTDSFLAYRPAGWLMLGLLYGAFLGRMRLEEVFAARVTRNSVETSAGSVAGS
jgi:O-antigen ligase